MGLTDDLANWNFELKCRQAVKALNENGFTAVYCGTRQKAYDYIISEAGEAKTIGFGGSLSVADLNVAEALSETGKELLIHGVPGLSLEDKLSIMRRQLTSDLFLTGTNALTLTGSLVNIDATGNRVASMIFGPKKVIVVAGRNKLADNTEEALRRIKAYASPTNTKRLNLSTPCAKTGFCTDCDTPDRICRITTILEKKPRLTDVHVLVVNEYLGL